jgi:hypothetical protein
MHFNGATMKHDSDKGEGGNPARDPRKDPRKDPSKDSRKDRLKLALRENLKRRKSQATGRSDAPVAPSNGGDAAPHGASGKKPAE